jgi:hypothetical protein
MPPAAPTANYSAVQAAVSDFQVIFQKMQVVVQKNVGQTIPQLCHISPAREQRAAVQERSNPGPWKAAYG